jgi:HEAT repeat protein
VLAARTLETARSQYPNAATSAEARALRVQVCSELARRGDGECAADVSVVVRDSSQLDEATKLAAMNALINMRADRAVPIATQALENPNQPPEVRKRAIFILADKAEEANAEAQVRATLVRVAASSAEDRELREQAIFWLSEIPGDETLDALTQLMSGTLDGDLKTRAIFAISQHDSPRAMGLLREYAEDSRLDVELRKQAIFWLGQEGEEQAVPYLTDLYGKVDDAELKQQILFAVAETDAASALDWLLARATDPAESLETRKKALFTLRKPARRSRGCARSMPAQPSPTCASTDLADIRER